MFTLDERNLITTALSEHVGANALTPLSADERSRDAQLAFAIVRKLDADAIADDGEYDRPSPEQAS